MKQSLHRFAYSCFLFAAPVVAAGPEHHGAAGHDHHGGIPWATLFFTFVNFSLFIWLLARFVWPQVRLWLRERHTTTVQELEAASQARREAEELRRQWEQRVARLDEEITRLRQQVEADLARERERVLQQAQRAAEAIRKDAERTVAAEMRRMEEELRAELVQQAMNIARELIRRHWSPGDQERTVDDFLRQVQP